MDECKPLPLPLARPEGFAGGLRSDANGRDDRTREGEPGEER